MKRVAVLVGVMTMAMTGLAPSAAQACIHGKAFRPPQVNPQLRDVRKAERLLAKNKHERAIKSARRAFAEFDQLPPDADVAPLFDRAQRTAAMAVVRAGGAVDLGGGWSGETEQERDRNLQWAAFIMQHQAARNPDNLVIQTEYAEALTKIPLHEEVAHGILVALSEDDLMPTARGYALLAQLQVDRGDEGASEVSLSRCEDIAGNRKACTVA